MARLRDPYQYNAPATIGTTADTQYAGLPGGTAGPARMTPYEDGGIGGPKSDVPVDPPSTATAHYISGNSGWDPAKLADTTHTTAKYQIGRVADQFNAADVRKDPTAFVKALQEAGFNPKQLSDDRWDFGGDIGYVDLIRGDNSWWWGQDGPGGGYQPAPAGTIGLPPGFGSGGSSGGGGGSSSSQPFDAAGIMAELKKLFPNGAFNQQVVNSRVSNASDILARNRKSQQATNAAFLADRGQGANDGTYASAAGNLETRLGEQFNTAVNDIFANESEAADARMIQALQIAAGMTIEEAKNAVDYARINSDNALGWGNIGLGYNNARINEMLGLGNLALGNTNAANTYNLGLGRLGLDRDTLLQDTQHKTMDEYIRLIEAYLNGANVSSGGHI